MDVKARQEGDDPGWHNGSPLKIYLEQVIVSRRKRRGQDIVIFARKLSRNQPLKEQVVWSKAALKQSHAMISYWTELTQDA